MARRGRGSLILAAVTPVVVAAAIGNVATMPHLVPWYSGLAKPSFTPPNWVFGPAWGTLYLLMILAFWRVLAHPRKYIERRAAIGWFLVQIVLNALWSVAFFGEQSPIAGVAVIALLVAAIVITVRRFAAVDGLAAVLLVPYLLWVGFAASLTVAIWRLNP